MKLPKSIRVGDYKVKIKRMRHDHEWGKFVMEDLVIYIAEDIKDSLLRDTLWHEILHTMWALSGLTGIEEPVEETMISVLTPTMVQFFKTNPEIMEIYA